MHSLEVYEDRVPGVPSITPARPARTAEGQGSDAETVLLNWLAVAFGAMVGGTTWLALRMQLHLDNIRGLGVLAACLGASTLFPPLRRLVGRYMRLLIRVLVNCGLLVGLVFLLSRFSPMVDARSSTIYAGAVALGIAAAIYAELTHKGRR